MAPNQSLGVSQGHFPGLGEPGPGIGPNQSLGVSQGLFPGSGSLCEPGPGIGPNQSMGVSRGNLPSCARWSTLGLPGGILGMFMAVRGGPLPPLELPLLTDGYI